MEKRVEDKYPQDFSSAWEIAQFPVYLDLDNYIQTRKGDKLREKYVDPVAIRRLGFLMEDSALKYFESKRDRDEDSAGFVAFNVSGIMAPLLKNYCKKRRIDDITEVEKFMMQVYLGGKEFQRFEDFDIEKLEELRDFSIELSKQARARFNEQGGLRRRYLVA